MCGLYFSIQGLNSGHTAKVQRGTGAAAAGAAAAGAAAAISDANGLLHRFTRSLSSGRRRLASPPNAPVSARATQAQHDRPLPHSAGAGVSPPGAHSGDARSSPRGLGAGMASGGLPSHGRVPISVLVRKTLAVGASTCSGASGRARAASRGPSPETVVPTPSDLAAKPPRARESSQKPFMLPGRTSKKGVAGADKDKEKCESELPVSAAAGSVKIDTSKAHSVFYVPCLKRTLRQLKFLELVTGKGNDPNVAIYWHDQLHHPLTKFHLCRLGEGQHMNRFLAMQCMARKNTLAKRLRRMQMLFPNEYNFMPQTWRFPWDVPQFKKQAKKTDEETGEPLYYILKPDNGSKGQGIRLTDHANVLKTWARMSLGAQQEEASDDDDECAPRKRSKGKQKPKPKKGKLQIPNFLEGQGRQVPSDSPLII